MTTIEKVKQTALKLWQRVKSGLAGGTAEEFQTAEKLLSDLMVKYGWNESDFLNAAESKNANEFTSFYTPNINPKPKKNPEWFLTLINMVSHHVSCKVIADINLGCALIGLPGNVKEFEDTLTFAIDRSSHTLNLRTTFATDGKKKLHKSSYMLGFVFGFVKTFAEKKAEERKAEAEAKGLDQTTTESLIAISEALEVAERQAEKVINETQSETKKLENEIKDQDSFLIGYKDGIDARKNLIAK